MRKESTKHRRLAGCVSVGIVFFSMMLAAAAGPGNYVSRYYSHTINSNSVSITFTPSGEPPEFVAVTVQRKEVETPFERYRAELKTNRNARFVPPPSALPPTPQWLPFQTNLLIDLGPGDGKRQVVFAFKYKGQAFDGSWSGSTITIQNGTPTLQIVNPTNFVVSQPMIQLQGVTSRKYRTLRYERFDSNGRKVGGGQDGLGTSFPGGYGFRSSDEYFSFLDVDLSPGANTFLFHGTDEFGNEMSTNVVIVFSTADDHTAPVIKLDAPRPNAEVAGETFTVRGQMDDFTAKLQARIQTKDGSTTRDALVERSGYFWFEEVPLVLGRNEITLTATDAAGNSSKTNFTILGREGPIVTMDHVEDPKDLWKRTIDATGHVTPAACNVWINGVQATVKSDGTWSAKGVPVVSPNGGTAVFDISAVPTSSTAANKTKSTEVMSAQSDLKTNAVILNASTPACGAFQLHLGETAGKSFVILASTNLIEWTPILTNMNADVSFDHLFDYSLIATNQPCRFFKVEPMP